MIENKIPKKYLYKVDLEDFMREYEDFFENGSKSGMGGSIEELEKRGDIVVVDGEVYILK